MQKRTKFLTAFLLCALNSVSIHAQNDVSYVDLTTPPLLRELQKDWTTPPFFTPRQKRARQVMHDNELVSNKIGQDANFYDNPLQINGLPLEYSDFDLTTKGILTVVKGNPNSQDAQPIPFYVSIRRNGKIITDKKMSFLNKTLYKINLSDILSFGRDGDVLIINPVKAEDWKAKRLLKLLGGC